MTTINNRKLTKQTIKPVLRFIGDWCFDIHSLNTEGAKFYSFTLDTYNGKNNFSGGFDWSLDGCYPYNSKWDINSEQPFYDYNKPYEDYAIDLETKEVWDLHTRKIIMQV